MPLFTCKLELTVQKELPDREAAERFFQDMDITFGDPDTKQPMRHDLVDWEITEK